MQSISVADLRAGDTETVDIEVAAARVDPGNVSAICRRPVPNRCGISRRRGRPRRNRRDERRRGGRNRSDRRSDATWDRGRRVPLFRCDSRNRRVPVDGQSVYEVRIANDGDESVTGVVATVEAQPPLSSESPTAYVGTLEPGDSGTARFALESSTDAIETTTSVTITLVRHRRRRPHERGAGFGPRRDRRRRRGY